jgi:hypothetical protein
MTNYDSVVQGEGLFSKFTLLVSGYAWLRFYHSPCLRLVGGLASWAATPSRPISQNRVWNLRGQALTQEFLLSYITPLVTGGRAFYNPSMTVQETEVA